VLLAKYILLRSSLRAAGKRMRSIMWRQEYVKGKNNVVADALSRRPATLSLMSLDTDWRARLLVEYSKERFACEVLDGQVADDRYRVVNEIIYYRDWFFLTKGS